MFQQIIGRIILGIGLVYAACILFLILRDRQSLRRAKGNFFLLIPTEVVIYIIASLGVSDFLLHTLLIKNFRLADDKELPGTLIGCAIVPGTILVYSLMRPDNPVDLPSLLVCSVCVIAGSFTGSALVSRLDGGIIRKIMIISLILSFVFLIVKMLLTAGVSGTAAGLKGPVLLIAAAACFGSGIVNMFGIPMKPSWTAIFLIAGLSPLAALTMTLFMGALTPLAGGINVLRHGQYHRKLVACAVIFGSLGAFIGTSLAVSLPAAALNIILIIVMLIAILSLLRK